jgi:hypothetical protein
MRRRDLAAPYFHRNKLGAHGCRKHLAAVKLKLRCNQQRALSRLPQL